MFSNQTTTLIPATNPKSTEKSTRVGFGFVRIAIAFLMVAGLLVAGTAKAEPASAATNTAQVTACFVHANGNAYTDNVYLLYWNSATGSWTAFGAPVLRPGPSGCVSWTVVPGYYYTAQAYVKIYNRFLGNSPYYAGTKAGGSYHLGTGTVIAY